jgi:hypothetical protein
VINVVNAGDAPTALIGLQTQHRCRQVAQLDDGTIQALCLAVVMVRYLIWSAVFPIVDNVMSCI